jgi:hypothetical protein
MSTQDIFQSLLTGVPDPEQVLSHLVPEMRWIRLDAAASPSVSQLEALRMFAPFCTQNLLQARRALTAGTAKVGPVPEDAARNLGETVFTPVGLPWRLEVLTPDELRQEGFAD